jgi:hypothetical protein
MIESLDATNAGQFISTVKAGSPRELGAQLF